MIALMKKSNMKMDGVRKHHYLLNNQPKNIVYYSIINTKIKFCKLCVEPNTRPNSIFNKEGICFSCQQITKKSKTNYKKRKRN